LSARKEKQIWAWKGRPSNLPLLSCGGTVGLFRIDWMGLGERLEIKGY
jgi:hypothetical protein